MDYSKIRLNFFNLSTQNNAFSRFLILIKFTIVRTFKILKINLRQIKFPNLDLSRIEFLTRKSNSRYRNSSIYFNSTASGRSNEFRVRCVNLGDCIEVKSQMIGNKGKIGCMLVTLVNFHIRRCPNKLNYFRGTERRRHALFLSR